MGMGQSLNPGSFFSLGLICSGKNTYYYMECV